MRVRVSVRVLLLAHLEAVTHEGVAEVEQLLLPRGAVRLLRLRARVRVGVRLRLRLRVTCHSSCSGEVVSMRKLALALALAWP